MARVTIEDCIDKVANRFELVFPNDFARRPTCRNPKRGDDACLIVAAQSGNCQMAAAVRSSSVSNACADLPSFGCRHSGSICANGTSTNRR